MQRRRIGRNVMWGLGVLVVLVALIVGGFMVVPSAPAPLAAAEREPLAEQPLPDDLPEIVARFYERRYGTSLQPPSGVVVSGHAWLKPAGPWYLPARFRFVHDAGNAYAHDIAITWFGLDVLRVDERFVDGRARMALPFGVEEHTPALAQGAALALWAEAVWFPTLWVTHPGVRWEGAGEGAAALYVPFEGGSLRALVTFDADGDIAGLVAERFAGAEASETSTWRNEADGWTVIDGAWRPRVGRVAWGDDPPWAVFTVTSVQEDVDVDALLRGPWRR
jgi:hypothetical protein